MGRHNIFAATTVPFRGAKRRHAKPFIEKELRAWLFAMKIKTLYIEPGNPWLPSEATPQRAKTRITNGFIEAFHNHLPDKCLNSDVLLNVSEAQVVIEQWLQTYNNEHLHSRLGFKSPTQEFVRFFSDLVLVRATPSLRQDISYTSILIPLTPDIYLH